VNAPDERPFFFVHVMKTAGATFRQHVYNNFADGEVYPIKGVDDMFHANTSIQYLLDRSPEQHAATRAYTGHFPFIASQMLDCNPITFTILRDPIDRTISYLKHAKVTHAQHADLELDEIYDDEFYFKCFMHNHQVKIFAMDRTDKLESYMDVIDIDEKRVETALAHLDEVDHVGFTDDLGHLMGTLSERYGWSFDEVPDIHVSDPIDLPAGLRERITVDNAADIEFYNRARARLHPHARREG